MSLWSSRLRKKKRADLSHGAAAAAESQVAPAPGGGTDAAAGGEAVPATRSVPESLEAAAAAVDDGKNVTAITILAEVPLEACGVGQLARFARLSKLAGDLGLWVAAGRACVERFPQSPHGYLALLADIDLLLSDTTQQAMALTVARSGLDALESGDLVSPAVAFHVSRVIDRFAGDAALSARSRAAGDSVFAAADVDGAVWHARDLVRRGDLEGAAEVLDKQLSQLDGQPSGELIFMRGRVALSAGRWGRDWEHLKALDELELETPGVLKAREEIDHVRALFADLGVSFDAGPTTADFGAISSPESAAEVICRPGSRSTDRSNATQGLLLAGGTLAAGGAERLLATCFREFRRRDVLGGVDLAILDSKSLANRDDPLFFLPLTGVSASELVYLPESGDLVRPFTYLPVGLGRRTQSWYDLISERRPSVVHAWLDYSMLTAGLAAVWAGVPKIILHSHNMRPESLMQADDPTGAQWRERGRGWNHIYAHLLARPEVHFVNVASAATQDYLDWIGIDESSVNAHTIHNGLDLAPFDEDGTAAAAQLRSSLGIPDDAPVVGTALRFSAVKQPDHWVEAAIQIRRQVPDAHFVMFGDGADREPLMAKIEGAGAAGYIHCPGRFSDLHLRLQLLDVFMLSSRSEGLPNVLVESQACGVPVVAYDVGGVRETFVDGVTGMLVRDTTPTALATAVVSALRSHEWRRAAGEEGRRFVRREFGIDTMVTRLVDLITA